MIELDVKNRLRDFGYIATDDDNDQITFCMSKVTNYILKFCNILSVPFEANEIAVDMSVGEFLTYKKKTGALDVTGTLGVSDAKSIKVGDMTVDFGNTNAGGMSEFDGLLAAMTHRDKDLIPYRRMTW